MLSEQSATKRVTTLLERSRKAPIAERKSILNELMTLYKEITPREEAFARQIRQAFLVALVREPQIWGDADFFHYLAEHLQPEDLEGLHWQEPSQVIALCEALYSFQFPSADQAEQVKEHVQNLLRHALQQFEQQNAFEKMFQLLHLAPISASLIEETELQRLRSRAYLYEMRRMQRNRRILYGYLFLYVLLVTVVFPYLFVYAENGAIQEKIEQAAEVEIKEEARQFLSYGDGLYWSLITVSSIGYGDITPVTKVGRMIAATLGIMGVITIAVFAGLILEWITPRHLD